MELLEWRGLVERVAGGVYTSGMNPEIREAVIRVFDIYVSQPEHGIVNLVQQRPQFQGRAVDIYRTVHWMRDRGELVPTGQDSLRLSYSFVESQAPWWLRTRKYMLDNWIAITGAVTGVAGFVISLVALLKGH